MFQLDQAELDFGIYRIMNAKREEITRFLDNDLLPQVREAFQAYEAENRGAVEAELAEAIEKAKELGADPQTLPRVKELRAKLAQAVDVTALENDVYSHLYNFFRRYYSEGDFISQRRYKEGVYAIPYEGEEVKLYWANHDQYYIKTSEYLRNYTFKLPSGKRVHFKLAQADTEKDNNRAPNGNERRFILSEEQPLAEEGGKLVIRFEYRPDPEKRKQADLNTAAVDRILNQTTGFDHWRQELASPRPTEKNPNRTLLEKHLTDYTARNTFDYFIHKDLGGFLRRELDFYIKNEVIHLDDVESDTAPRVEQYLSKIKAIRRIAHKIIDFLAQIEDFQKKLWLKKKFVVETQYCITLDRIFAIEDDLPAAPGTAQAGKTRDWLLDQIIKNDAQREEWVRLFAIDEIKGDLTTPGYSTPLKREFLKAHPTLVVDTRHFDQAFKLRLLAAIPDIDEETDGLLIHSENFQALNLLLERYRGQVKCIYIDPPYNTGEDEFPYKDSYQHSSWITMMDNKLDLYYQLLCDSGVFVSHIDENEFNVLDRLVHERFGPQQNIGPIVWDKRNPKGDAIGIASQHEYLCWAVKNREVLKAVNGNLRRKKENAEAILTKAKEIVQKYGGVTDSARTEFKNWVTRQDFSGGEKAYCELDDNGDVYQAVYMAWPNKQKAPDEYFKQLIHPVTKKPCPVPSRGWRYPPQTMNELLEKRLILFGPDESTQPRRKYLLKDNIFENVPSLYYFGGSDDSLQAAIGYTFPNPKPVRLGEYVISIAAPGKTDCVLDFFAGSGTTGHAVISLNREDGGRRKFILVEMGEYFDTVLVPRLKKVIFTPEWKDGKPKRMATPEEVKRSPRILKILRLESYEDTLNNLELRRTDAQQKLLEEHPEFREDYMLRYMLDVESRGSASLLNIDRFEDPFHYKLNIATGTAGETKPTVVDLVETFNYLLGLRVKTIDHIGLPAAQAGRAAQAGGVRVVTGLNPQGERVLILWRKTKELDNDALDAWFRKQGYNTKDQEYDVIYVNGDNNLENLRKPDQTWKVRLIEEEFRRLMFDVQDV